VPSFRRRDSVIDADRVEQTTPDPDRPTDAKQARALVEEAEAEAAEAEALAAAARAKARAARLRRQALADDAPTDTATQAAEPEIAAEAADTADGPSAAGPVGTDSDADDALDIDAVDIDGEPATARRRLVPRPGWKAFAATVAILCTLGLLAVSGLMLWKHQDAEKLRQQQAEYAAAGRQSVVTLMSLDFNKAEEDVQRIIDNSTGQFKTDFESQAADFVKVAQDSKVITEVSVNSTAVESMSDEQAQVLVAASSRVTNTAGAQQEPRTWRLSVSLEREGDQIKMAKVEFVP
jgi:Mce-associated membrane protein